MAETALVPVESLDITAIFTKPDDLDGILKDIEQKAMAHVPVMETATGRKDIASMAHKVARSKTLLDGAGKELVADIKKQAKAIDISRKKARDFLDDLKVRVRQPLTDWEAEEEKKIAAEQLRMEIEQDHAEAIGMHDLFTREAEVAAKEAELARQEEERRQKEEAERRERERKEREERIAREAAEQARKEAEEAAARERIEAIEAANRAERERQAVVEKAEQERQAAERERIAAEERAKLEKEFAIKQERERAEKAEQERKAKEEAERIAAEKKAANKKHQDRINREAVGSLIELGFHELGANELVGEIAAGKVKHVTIIY